MLGFVLLYGKKTTRASMEITRTGFVSVLDNRICQSEITRSTDVVIVGAGVAGAALAYTLGKVILYFSLQPSLFFFFFLFFFFIFYQVYSWENGDLNPKVSFQNSKRCQMNYGAFVILFFLKLFYCCSYDINNFLFGISGTWWYVVFYLSTILVEITRISVRRDFFY